MTDYDFGKKKKKKIITSTPQEVLIQDNNTIDTLQEVSQLTVPIYDYEFLLKRLSSQMEAQAAIQPKKKVCILLPSVCMSGAKITVWINFSATCKCIGRDPDVVSDFLNKEWSTTSSINSGGSLLIKGRFKQDQIIGVFKRYIFEYVKCRQCSSLSTLLVKEKRSIIMQCEDCFASRTL